MKTRIEFPAKDIVDAARQATEHRSRTGTDFYLQFNGCLLLVDADSKVKDLIDQYVNEYLVAA